MVVTGETDSQEDEERMETGRDADKPGEHATMVDVMGSSERWKVDVHDHGSITLVDVMPRLVPEGRTADQAIVQAARVSYGQGTKGPTEDARLVRYLMRCRHTTPFEMVELKFHCVVPQFVARQWMRHRTASINEISARYTVVGDRFYRPDPSRAMGQSQDNKMGSTPSERDAELRRELELSLDRAEARHEDYVALVENGMAREVARMILPQNVYTEFYWKANLHNTFRFLELRMDGAAQSEIRSYAQAMFELVKRVAPVAARAFQDYVLEGIRLTGPELSLLRGARESNMTEREKREFSEKGGVMGLMHLC